MLVRSYFHFLYVKVHSLIIHWFIKYEFLKRKILGRLDTKHCFYSFFKIDYMKPYNFKLRRSSKSPYFTLFVHLHVVMSLPSNLPKMLHFFAIFWYAYLKHFITLASCTVKTIIMGISF